jgi:hypothetical protein
MVAHRAHEAAATAKRLSNADKEKKRLAAAQAAQRRSEQHADHLMEAKHLIRVRTEMRPKVCEIGMLMIASFDTSTKNPSMTRTKVAQQKVRDQLSGNPDYTQKEINEGITVASCALYEVGQLLYGVHH